MSASNRASNPSAGAKELFARIRHDNTERDRHEAAERLEELRRDIDPNPLFGRPQRLTKETRQILVDEIDHIIVLLTAND